MEIQKLNSVTNIGTAKIKDNGDTVSITIPKKTAKTAAMLASSMLALASMAQADIQINNNTEPKVFIQNVDEKPENKSDKQDDFYKSLATLAFMLTLSYGAATIANKKDLHIIPRNVNK